MNEESCPLTLESLAGGIVNAVRASAAEKKLLFAVNVQSDLPARYQNDGTAARIQRELSGALAESIARTVYGYVTLSVTGETRGRCCEMTFIVADTSSNDEAVSYTAAYTLTVVDAAPAALVNKPQEKRALLFSFRQLYIDSFSGAMERFGAACDCVMSAEELCGMLAKRRYDYIFIQAAFLDGVEEMIRKTGGGARVIVYVEHGEHGPKHYPVFALPFYSIPLARVLNGESAECAAAAPDAAAPCDAPADGEGPLARLRLIAELDTERALERMGGREDLFLTLIRSIAENIPESLHDLDEYLASHDMDSYCIVVHSIKSNLRSVGSTALADKAFTLEQKSREHDEAFCAEHTQPFAEEVRALIKRFPA